MDRPGHGLRGDGPVGGWERCGGEVLVGGMCGFVLAFGGLRQ